MADNQPKRPGKGNRTNHPTHGSRWNKGMRTAQQNFRVNPDVLRGIKAHCAEQGISINDWLEKMAYQSCGDKIEEFKRSAQIHDGPPLSELAADLGVTVRELEEYAAESVGAPKDGE